MSDTTQGGNEEEPNRRPRISETEVQYQKALNRRELYAAAGTAIRYLSAGLAAGVVVQLSVGLVELLAGRETDLTIDVSLGLTLSGGLAAAIGYLGSVVRRQRREILRLRRRINDLEGRLWQLGGLPSDEEGHDEGEQP